MLSIEHIEEIIHSKIKLKLSADKAKEKIVSTSAKRRSSSSIFYFLELALVPGNVHESSTLDYEDCHCINRDTG